MAPIKLKIRRVIALGFCIVILFFLMVGLFVTSIDDEIDITRAMKRFTSNLQYRKEVPVLVAGLGNFEPTFIETRVGPGEGGQAYKLPIEKIYESLISFDNYRICMTCSDEISLDRSVKDTRLEECKHWNYPLDLPKASVIIVFHNEGWSVLMRTVHSVMNRSSEKLLHEIILIDDFSDKEDLHQNLDNYIKRFNGKVKIIRNKVRDGLIRSKIKGAEIATGEVILFLDAHCEVNINWLPPLLAPISRNSKIMTVPIVDGIDDKTFEYTSTYDDNHYRGIFDWGLTYNEKKIPEKEANKRKYNSEPYQSPAHAGGLFAINREYFLQLGAYDPGLLIWGGENSELSFKIWQCGGSIEWIPCSRVGHIYRDLLPYSFGQLPESRNTFSIESNYKRVVETWFDDKFKKYFYTRYPIAVDLDMGDISEQLRLKKKLKCKNFQWYIDNVAYDVFEDFPALPPNLDWGQLRLGPTDRCLTASNYNELLTPMILQRCVSILLAPQLIRLNVAGQLAVGEFCIDVDQVNRTDILLIDCPVGSVHGPWRYDAENYHLVHGWYENCITVDSKNLKITLNDCDETSLHQEWIFKNDI